MRQRLRPSALSPNQSTNAADHFPLCGMTSHRLIKTPFLIACTVLYCTVLLYKYSTTVLLQHGWPPPQTAPCASCTRTFYSSSLVQTHDMCAHSLPLAMNAPLCLSMCLPPGRIHCTVTQAASCSKPYTANARRRKQSTSPSLMYYRRSCHQPFALDRSLHPLASTCPRVRPWGPRRVNPCFDAPSVPLLSLSSCILP